MSDLVSRPGTGIDTSRLNGKPLTMSDLRTAEMLLVWAVRRWVACHKSDTDARLALREGFRSGNVESALDPFDRIFRIIATTAKSPRDVRCPNCHQIGDGERDFLQAFALWQNGHGEAATTATMDWLPSAAARIASHSFQELAGKFAERGLVAPMRAIYRPVLSPEQALSAYYTTSETIH
ncbi:MAG: hypothetical protein AAGL49_10745 [Pseudomonadota bacterium]